MKQVIRIIVLLWPLTLIVGKATGITCIINEDCVLPCISQYHDIIHWYNDKKAVHSFYDKRDQLGHQNPDYKGRTSMFSEQIPKGNISLLLKQVRINDKGTYKCYTANQEKNNEAYIVLNVKAPIKQVDIEVNDDVITCTTKEVHSKPNVIWYIENNRINDSNIVVSNDEQGLFTLQSTLTSQPIQNLTYNCTITLTDQSETYTTSLRPVPDVVIINSGDEASIRCPFPQNSNETFNIRLSLNDSHSILIYNNQEPQTKYPSKMWGDINVQLTPEGKLNLLKLDIAKDEGIYTCEMTTAQSKQTLHTSLQIKPGQSIASVTVITGVIIGIILGVIIIAVIVLCVYKKRAKKKNTDGQPQEREALSHVTSKQDSDM